MTGKSDVKRYQGGCLCGAVTFEVALPATFVGHCHCSMCRRAHGAAYVTWVGVPVGMFYLTKGKETLVVTRSFCGRCGSPMFCNDARHAEATRLIR